ncbi:MAG: murI [Firmicutes bacterium]|nr:murI [Bacillota bacterium]
MKIGIFDSGIGGLTVLHQALITLPKEDYIYYADTDNVPYGIKTREEIIGYVDRAVDFLVGKGVKAIVIACNTATSTAADYVRSKYTLPILGMEPAVKPAVAKSHGKRVMVIATPVTVREEKLRALIEQVDDEHLVDLVALPGLVSFAEAGIFEGNEIEQYLRHELSDYHLANYSALILGCTHFNYFKDSYCKVFPKGISFIDGSVGTVNYLKRILTERNLLENNHGTVEYYMSGRPVYRDEELQKLSGLHMRLDKMLKL